MIENSGIFENEKQLNSIIKEAYTKVPFYKDLMVRKKIDINSADFFDLPIVFKNDFLESDYVNLNIELMKELPEIISMKTSGTLGEPFEVKWGIVDERKSLLQLWLYRKRYYAISPDDKLCYFFPSYIEDIDELTGKKCLAFSRKCIYDGSIGKVYNRIVEYNPKWMILQPSMALALCEQAEVLGNIPSNLKYIECTGEELSDAIREKIKKTFKCAIANQYGCKEVGSIAYECPYGNMHIMKNSIIVEVDSETSDVYVTSLDNHVMPFIRYATGDKGTLNFVCKCECGNDIPSLKLARGRKEEYIYQKDGRKLHSYAVTQIIDSINFEFNNSIIQYRITQNDYSDFLFEIVVEEMSSEDKIKRMLYYKAKQRLGVDVNVEINIYTDFMCDVNREKHLTFINKL